MSHPFASFMEHARTLALRGRWHVAPNPMVGAVLVRDGQVVAEGWHAVCGGDHAEVACLADAASKGVNPADCTLVVTLEPCRHEGRTPPCVNAILEAGIRHVVVGLADPTPEAGGGAAVLREQGVLVETGIDEDACRELIADFLIWQNTRRPYVILKLATTLDGRIGTRTGHSQWISSEASRHKVHEMRANVGLGGGAVLIGSNTLHADDPLLTARDVEVTRQPLAVAITSRLPGNDNAKLLRLRPSETIFFTTASGAATPRAGALRKTGVRVVPLDSWKSSTGDDLRQTIIWLREEAQCLYVLCEGGGKLGLSMLEAGLVDEFHIHMGPKILADNEARPLFDGRSPLTMNEALPLTLIHAERCGGDCHLMFRPCR